VAVYSRCRREPLRTRLSSEIPDYSSARGCRLYLYSFARRRERPLVGTHISDGSEFLPVTWRGSAAFVRLYQSRPPAQAVVPHIELVSNPGGRSSEIPGGTPGISDLGPSEPAGPGPVGLALRGRKLAFVWIVDTPTCGNQPPSVVGSALAEVWADDIDHPGPRLMDRYCSYDSSDLDTGPTFIDANRLAFVAYRDGGPTRLIYVSTTSARRQSRSLGQASVQSIASDTRRLYLQELRGSRARAHVVSRPIG